MKVKLLTTFVILLVGLEVARGQANLKEKASIMVLSRPYKDSILLRWAPNNVGAWQELNKEGYLIKRLTISTNGKYNKSGVYKILTRKPIKPLPIEGWEKYVEREDKYGSIAAQALYGEDFEITQKVKGAGAGEVVNMLKANEQRFSIALFCADQSFELAKAMGLAFVDTTALSNEVYQYQIYSVYGKKMNIINAGIIQTGFSGFKPLPKPKGLKAEASEKGVLLSWLTKPYLGIFTYYQLERSLDTGKTFVNTSDLPLINAYEKEDMNPDLAFQFDSVSALNRKIIYRVKGVSPFSEPGPPSDTISATFFHHLQNPPSIVSLQEQKGTVTINWSMPKSEAEVLGFEVLRSDHNDKGFVKVNAARISPKDSSYIDLKPKAINFYRVKAIGRGDTFTESYTRMLKMPDSIPPAPPTELKGTINKQGIAKISWKTNTEKDLYGYRVFRSNDEKGEYSQITRSTRLPNNYTDTIELKTLTKYVFYKLVAIDKNYNPSGFSETLKLKRPDIVPPAPPAFTSVVALTQGIGLKWFRSPSEDVVKHELLRTQAGEDSWKILAFFTDTTQSYIDESAGLNQKFSYKLRAIDESYLMAESKPVISQRLDLKIQPNVVNFRGIADRDNQHILLKWAYKQLGVSKYLLYKAEVDKPLRLFKMIDAKADSFTDAQLYINTAYEYRIKAVFTDGTESGFSKPIIVNY